MKLDGFNAIAAILIASFAIDRIVTALLFALSYVKAWARAFPDPSLANDAEERVGAEKKQKLAYFTCAALLAIGVLGWFGNIRIFNALGIANMNQILDIIATGVILIGGSDQIAALLLKLSDASGKNKAAARPIEITGKIVLKGAADDKALKPKALKPLDIELS